MTLLDYVSPDGLRPFRRWFERLEATAAAKVNTALTRLQLGNTSNVESVGAGVLELKVHFGPGYRVYFGKDGDAIVILLAGGTKQRQHRDIADAHRRWQEYKQRTR